MKIICISTLDKFSRFYLDIERQLKANSDADIQLKIFSMYLSGFLYTVLRLKPSQWISLKAWRLAKRRKNQYLQIIQKEHQYKGIVFNDFIKFHKALDERISITRLQLQALAYIDIFEDLYAKYEPNYIISIGDSRLCVEIAIAVAKKYHIKIYYIEQGPFNTTFLDEKGVNANLSIREDFKHASTDYQSHTPSISLNFNTKKYHRLPIYRGLDILFMTLFEKTRLYPPDLKYTDLNSYKSKRMVAKIEHLNTLSQSVYLLILQVPLDVNMICHSPLFKSHLEIITSIFHNLPRDVKFIVREHPLYINKYEDELYAYINANDITIDNSSPLDAAIETAKVIIVNNSTVGIEALLKYKTVVVLGNAFYDDDKIVLKLKDINDLKLVLQNALHYTPNRKNIDTFKNLFLNRVLIQGAISDKILISSKHIAKHLIANH